VTREEAETAIEILDSALTEIGKLAEPAAVAVS
jgi:hypothetical protein